MGQSSRGATLIHTPAIMAIAGCMFILSLLVAPSVQALSLDPVLDAVTVATKTLTRNDKEVKPSRSSSTSSPGNQQSAASAKTPVPTVAPSTSSSVAAPSEEVIVAEPLQQLPTIDDPSVGAPPITPVRPITAATVSAEAYGAQSATTPLQATEQGWTLFGIAWYWLVVGGASLWGGFMSMCRYYVNRSHNRLIPLLLRVGAVSGDV
jgi:hypothetical protein